MNETKIKYYVEIIVAYYDCDNEVCHVLRHVPIKNIDACIFSIDFMIWNFIKTKYPDNFLLWDYINTYGSFPLLKDPLDLPVDFDSVKLARIDLL